MSTDFHELASRVLKLSSSPESETFWRECAEDANIAKLKQFLQLPTLRNASGFSWKDPAYINSEFRSSVSEKALGLYWRTDRQAFVIDFRSIGGGRYSVPVAETKAFKCPWTAFVYCLIVAKCAKALHKIPDFFRKYQASDHRFIEIEGDTKRMAETLQKEKRKAEMQVGTTVCATSVFAS